VNAIRPPEAYGERPSRMFEVGSRDSALGYVQTDGAILGAFGLFVMLAATVV